jgi:putative membrane protein
MNLALLPTVNAVLNAASAALLLAGLLSIRAPKVGAHTVLMLAALAVSAAFLISYLTYHLQVGSVHFPGTGWVRPVYFAILITHTVLAVVIVPLVLRTLFLAIRKRFTEHMAIARWTLPLWFYVSVSGVVVYWMLYHSPWSA